MHRALHIQEILRQVFEHLVPHFDVEDVFLNCSPYVFTQKETAHLLHAALTCRVFKEPALDVLWWAMDDLTPLFSLFSGYKELKSEDGRITTKVIRGPILESDSQRFLNYAKRIKLYHFTARNGISSSSYFQVLHAIGGTCLLPSLNYLFSDMNHPWPELHLLLSRHLQAFCYSGLLEEESAEQEAGISDIWAFVDSLPRAAPSLAYLQLKYRISEAGLQSIAQLPNLKSLEISHCAGTVDEYLQLGPDFFETFSASTTLSRLSLEGPINFLPNTALPPHIHTFTSLRNIHFTRGVANLRQMTTLLSVATFPSLEALTIRFLGSSTTNEQVDKYSFRDFFRHLVQATTSAFCYLILDVNPLPNGREFQISFANIPEVLKLHLTCLDFPNLNPTSLTDIRSIISAWPRIEVLCLSPSFNVPTSIGFDALLLFATGLPHLLTLKIKIDYGRLPATAYKVPILRHGLVNLCSYAKSGPTDPLLLATCLDRIFPSVRYRTFPFKKSCVQVRIFLKALQCARMDQKIRDSEDYEPDMEYDIEGSQR